MSQLSSKSNPKNYNGTYPASTENGQPIHAGGVNSSPTSSQTAAQAAFDEFSKIHSAESPPAGKGTKVSGTTLRNQLLRIFLPLTLGPLAIASFVGYRVVDGLATEAAEEDIPEIALLTGEATLRFVEDSRRVSLAVASNPLIINSARQYAQQAADEGLPEKPIEALEQQFANTKSLEINQVLNDYMQSVVDNEGLDKLHVTQRDGYVFTYSIPTGDFVQSDESWWQNTRDNIQWLEKPEIDPSTGEFSVDFSQAVIDPSSGAFLGVVQAVIAADSFEAFVIELLESFELTGSQQVQVVDAGSDLVIGTLTAAGQVDVQDIVGGEAIRQAIAALTAAREQTGNLQQVLDEVKSQHGLRDIEITSLENTGVAGATLTADFTYRDKRFSVVAIPNADWAAVSSMDLSEIYAAGRNLALLMALLAVTLSGVTIFLVLWLANQLSQPLKGLSGVAEQVSLGDLNAFAMPQGTSETQTLAETFNNLVARVKVFLGEQTTNTEKARVLADVASSPARTLPGLFESFEEPLNKARDLVEIDRLVVYQMGGPNQVEVLFESAAPGWFRDLEKRLTELQMPEPILEAAQQGRVFSIDDFSTANLPAEYVKLMRRLDVQSTLVAPILAGDRLLGLLVGDRCAAPQPWEPTTLDFLSQLASQLGLVIDRVTLLNTTEQQATEQRQLKESLQRRALELLQEVDPISQGDLTVRAKVTADEIGTIADSYNAIVASLRRIVAQVQTAALQVAETTQVNEVSVQELSAEAAQQATDITAALDQLEAMNAAIRNIAISAEQAESAVQQAARTVEAGDIAMNQTVEGIQAIRETVAETAKKVKHLGESSQKISTVVELISAFAAQTNMLALNASIEASRAGEEGRGFAVVAEEVRGLARKSAEATEEIRKLIANIQVETNEVVAAMETGTDKVVKGTRLVDATRQNLNQITAVSAQISQLVEAIAQSTIVQAQSAETVTHTMQGVAEIANKTSVGANQVSLSFEELRKVAQTLQEGVSQFKVN
ncbi:MAG: methyl-accepting chemotaxis protein [Synechococcales bacterium]|nr:methyl-accepting chemotaxis protein [Synechococcales bacterium]